MQRRYLVGTANSEGALRPLLKAEQPVEVIEEGFLRASADEALPPVEHLDFQFARAIPEDDAQPEELERYRRPLTRLANTLFPLPRMFSLDVMLSSGGGLRFLEANTHPGTLAQPELQGSETPLNRYITFLLETDFDPDRQASALWRWRNEEGRQVWGDLRQGEPDGRLDVTPAQMLTALDDDDAARQLMSDRGWSAAQLAAQLEELRRQLAAAVRCEPPADSGRPRR